MATSFGKTWWGEQWLNSLNIIDYSNRLPRGASYARKMHKFITKNTFEEKINDMIQKKKALAEMTVATGENWIGNLSNKELRQIFEM